MIEIRTYEDGDYEAIQECVEPVTVAEGVTVAKDSGAYLTVTEDGKPVAGMHVFAYTERVIGHKRPAALSSPTGADGRFALQLPVAGTYYIGARQQYGDSPAPGELFGMYDESADHGLEVGPDAAAGRLRIVVEPIELF